MIGWLLISYALTNEKFPLVKKSARGSESLTEQTSDQRCANQGNGDLYEQLTSVLKKKIRC